MTPPKKSTVALGNTRSQSRILARRIGGRLRNILWTLGITGMIVLGYVTAVHARDMVWLLVPALAIVLTLLSIGKIFRK